VRVLAATNKNLREEIERHDFREDLYHRLSVILIEVPSLNDRKDDIPLLVDHFVKDICQNQGSPLLNVLPDAIEELQKIQWTGNIRELRNVVERLIILCDREITGEDVKRYAHPLRR
jgi:DNA-binding NtrC family response regulator